VLRAVDELHDEGDISDATWDTLAQRFDRPQLIELVALIGNYHMLSFLLNALRIEPEPDDSPGFPVTGAAG
jgi:alkylhydroperoxidase family enzyme